MHSQRITLTETAVRIVDLVIPRKEAAEFLRAYPEEEREQALVRAVEVGVFCLERSTTGQDTEFVRRQVEHLLSRVEKSVETIPKDVETALAAKIGTAEGQVLAPIQSAVTRASDDLGRRVKEVRELLTTEVDPSKENTTLGRALKSIRDLLDSNRVDSVQRKVETAVEMVSREDGVLATVVKAAAEAAVRPLVTEVDRLAKEVRGKTAAAEALEQTTKKGTIYEEEVVEALSQWSQGTGVTVEHVGRDNRPGDVVVESVYPAAIAARPIRIVVEARDQQTRAGRRTIAGDASYAMVERGAQAAVYVSRTADGLGKDVGEWAEGEAEPGPWVACTHEHLITAVRFVLVWVRAAAEGASTPIVDAASIQTQVQRIRDALGRVGTINRKAGELRDTAGEIGSEADRLRTDIKGALLAIEDALKVQPLSSDAPSKKDRMETSSGSGAVVVDASGGHAAAG